MKLTSSMAAFGLMGALALTACGSSRDGAGNENENAPGTQQPGTPGSPSTQNPDGLPSTPTTPPTVATKATIAELRATGQRGAHVEVENLVIHSIVYTKKGTLGDVQADFWAYDEANPTSGIWIEKHYKDLPAGYEPKVGEKISVNGWYGTLPPFENVSARRPALRSEVATVGKGATRSMEITVTGNVEVSPLAVAEGFGDSKGGSVSANDDHRGALVTIGGELVITNAQPEALARLNLDGSVAGYNGFEITGGILVNTSYTFRECDLNAAALVEGAVVRFPAGVTGAWDTYSFAQCETGADVAQTDGTTKFQCERYKYGAVPGSTLDSVNVLYPRTCADLVVAQ